MRYRTPTPQILRPLGHPEFSVWHFGFSLTTRRSWFTAPRLSGFGTYGSGFVLDFKEQEGD